MDLIAQELKIHSEKVNLDTSIGHVKHENVFNKL